MPYIPRKEKTPEQTEEAVEAVVTKTDTKPSKAKESEEGATETAKKAIEDTGDEPETSASGAETMESTSEAASAETMGSTSEAASAETMESTSEAACAETKAGTLKRGQTDTSKPTEDQSTYDDEFEELKAKLKTTKTLRLIKKNHTGPSGVCSETEEPIAYKFGLNSPGLIAVYNGDQVSQELLEKKRYAPLERSIEPRLMSEHIFDHTECIFRVVGFTRNFPARMCMRDPCNLDDKCNTAGFSRDVAQTSYSEINQPPFDKRAFKFRQINLSMWPPTKQHRFFFRFWIYFGSSPFAFK